MLLNAHLLALGVAPIPFLRQFIEQMAGAEGRCNGGRCECQWHSAGNTRCECRLAAYGIDALKGALHAVVN